MKESNCPSREELVAYLSGSLRADVAVRIGDHVDSCATCQGSLEDAVETLDAVTPLAAAQEAVADTQKPGFSEKPGFVFGPRVWVAILLILISGAAGFALFRFANSGRERADGRNEDAPSLDTQRDGATTLRDPQWKSGESIDLLALIKPDNDAGRFGAWKWSGAGWEMRNPPSYGAAVLSFPLAVEGSYDLHVRLEQVGCPRFVINFPIGQDASSVVVRRGREVTVSLAMASDSSDTGEVNPSTTAVDLQDDRAYELTIKVRGTGHQADISVLLDNQPIIEWRGERSQLASFEQFAPYRRPQVGVHVGGSDFSVQDMLFTLAAARLELVEGGAETVSVTPAVALGPPVNPEQIRPIEIPPEPPTLKPGEPFGSESLACEPAQIEGVRCWTLETKDPRGGISSLSYSPDGQFLAIGSYDGTIRIRNTETNELARMLTPHDGVVYSLDWSADGRFLASGVGNAVYIWDAPAGRCLRVDRSHHDDVFCVAWSPDNRFLASASQDNTIRLWDFVEQQELEVLKAEFGGAYGRRMAWSPDGRKLTFACPKRSVLRVWNRASRDLEKEISTPYCAGVVWSRDGRFLLAGTDSEAILPIALWQTEDWVLHATIGQKHPSGSKLVWLPDGKTVIGRDGDGGLSIWDLNTGQIRHQPRGYGGVARPFQAIAYSPNRRSLAAGDRTDECTVWQADSWAEPCCLSGHGGGIKDVSTSPCGGRLAIVRPHGLVVVVQLATGEVVTELQHVESSVESVLWAPNEERLVTHMDGTVRVWDVTTGRCVKTFSESVKAECTQWSADSTALCTSDGATVRIWDSASWGQIGEFTTACSELSWSPDCRTLASSDGEVVKLWSVGSWKQAGQFPGNHAKLAWSTRDATLAVCFENTVEIRDSRNGRFLRLLRGAEGTLQGPAWSWDGGRLAAHAAGNRVLAWNLDTLGMVDSYDAGANVEEVLWSRDGKRIIVIAETLLLKPKQQIVSVRDLDSKEVTDWRTEKALAIGTAQDDHFSLEYENSRPLMRLRQLRDGEPIATLVPFRERQFAVVGPGGHFRGASNIENEFVCVVTTDEGEFRSIMPMEFAAEYGWKNDAATVPSPVIKPASTVPSTDQPTVVELAAEPVRELPEAKLSGGPILVDLGEPLSSTAWVSRPEKIVGLRSWSIEPRGFYSHIGALATSPDGKLIAAGGYYSGTIRIYSSELTLERTLLGHSGHIGCLAWSPDSRFLASGGRDSGSERCIWEVKSGRLLRRYPGGARGAAWSPDGQRVVVGGRLFDFSDAHDVSRKVPLGGNRICWSPDGSTAASRHDDGKLRICRTDTWEVVREIDGTRGLAGWSPDGRWFVYSTKDNLVIVDTASDEVAREYPFPGKLAWSPWGDKIAACNRSGGSENVTVLKTATGQELGRLSTKMESGDPPVGWLSGDDEIAAVGSTLVRLYDSTSFEQQKSAGSEGLRYGGAAIVSPDGGTVLTTGRHSTALLFDAVEGRSVGQIRDVPYATFRWSPLDDWIAARGTDGMSLINPRDPTTRKTLWTDMPGVTGKSWSPDGRLLAVGSRDKTVRVWSVENAEQIQKLDHSDEVLDVAWSPNGKLLAALSDDFLCLWDASSFELAQTIDDVPNLSAHGPALSWDPDSRLLFIVMDTQPYVVYALDTRSNRMRTVWAPHASNRINGGHFSPDGLKFAAYTGYESGWIFYRDTGDRTNTVDTWGYRGQFVRPRWLPDSRRLLVSNSSGDLYGFDTDTNRKLGMLIPSMSDDQYVCIGPEGHYRGSEKIDDHIVYVAMHEDGSQAIYTPSEFEETFGWQNNPEKTRFLQLDPPDTSPPSDEPLHAQTKNPDFSEETGFLPADPISIQAGQPLTRHSLVSEPAPVDGLKSWSIEFTGFQGSGYLSSIEVSPDSGLIAITDSGTTGNDRHSVPFSPNIRIYDRQCKLKRILVGHEGAIASTCWSPDGRYLASTGLDETVRLWDVNVGRLLRTMSLSGDGETVRWSPDGRRLVVACSDQVNMIDPHTGEQTAFASSTQASCIDWSPDGSLLVLAVGRNLQIWQVDSAKESTEIEVGRGVKDVRWSPDGLRIAGAYSDSSEKYVGIWEAKTGELKHKLSAPGHSPSAVAWSPGGDRLVSVGSGRPVMWDTTIGAVVTEGLSDVASRAVCWSLNGKYITAANYNQLQVWSASDLFVLYKFPVIRSTGSSASSLHSAWATLLTPDGAELFVGRSARLPELLKFDSIESKFVDLQADAPRGRWRLSPTGEQVAIAGDDGLHVGDPTTGEFDVWLVTEESEVSAAKRNPVFAKNRVSDPPPDAQPLKVRDVVWSWGGKRLAASGSDQTIRILDVAEPKTLHELKQEHRVCGLAWSRDNKWLATAGDDQHIRIWDATSGGLNRTFGPLPSAFRHEFTEELAWSTDDGQLAAALNDGAVVLVDTKSGEASEPVLQFPAAANRVLWSPDGSMLLAASKEDHIGIWHLAFGIWHLETKNSKHVEYNLNPVGWLPDNQHILLASSSPGIIVGYDVQNDRRLGILFSTISGGQWVVISPDGHYRGTRRIEDYLVYVALTEDGRQETYTPSAFRARFGWKNDPDKARLLGPEE